jgi:glucosamine 6-phosphate synthetase-like amidotransferase/phosphosugar isomerase protein
MCGLIGYTGGRAAQELLLRGLERLEYRGYVPLQLLAYRIARLRGRNVDQPRNLAKTVTAE